MCPTMQEDYIEQVHAVDGGFNGQSRRKYDLFSNTYNPGWRDHPNLCYGNPPQQGNQGRQFHPHGFQPQQNYQAVTLQQNVMSFQQETRSSIHNLEKQMG